MKGLSPELTYILIFAFIFLFQYLMKRYGPKEEQGPAPEEFVEETPYESPPIPATVDSASLARIAAAEAAERALAARQGRRFSRSSLMGGKREMQNAIAIATILGPCRAFEPHDIK